MNLEKKGSSTRLWKKVIELPRATQKHAIPGLKKKKAQANFSEPTKKA